MEMISDIRMDTYNPAPEEFIPDLADFTDTYLDCFCCDADGADGTRWWHVDLIYMGFWRYPKNSVTIRSYWFLGLKNRIRHMGSWRISDG